MIKFFCFDIWISFIKKGDFDWGGSALTHFKIKAVDDSNLRDLMTLERIAAEDLQKENETLEKENNKLKHIEQIMSDMRKKLKDLEEHNAYLKKMSEKKDEREEREKEKEREEALRREKEEAEKSNLRPPSPEEHLLEDSDADADSSFEESE